jgi:hypothetical protein
VGPKGYRRRDERIREDVNETLRRDPHLNAEHIEVDVAEGVVTLSGHVPNRWMKHRAEDNIWDLLGIREVKNQLYVKPDGAFGATNSEGTLSLGGTGVGTASGTRQTAASGAEKNEDKHSPESTA